MTQPKPTKQVGKFTPGPYKVRKWRDGRLSVDAGTVPLAVLDDSFPETVAVARLFAQAPKMYELLQDVLDISVISPNTLKPTCSLVVEARRIKAEIDGEAKHGTAKQGEG